MLLHDMLLEEGEKIRPFLSLLGEDRSFSLSKQVYPCVTNISASCTSTTNQIKLSKPNGWDSHVLTHQRQSSMFPLAH